MGASIKGLVLLFVSINLLYFFFYQFLSIFISLPKHNQQALLNLPKLIGCFTVTNFTTVPQIHPETFVFYHCHRYNAF